METIFSVKTDSEPGYIAFFDLDQTLTRSISGRALARGAFRKGLMKYSDLLNAVFLSLQFRLRLRAPIKIIDKMVSWVKGIPEKTIIDLCYEVFNEVLKPSVYREAIAEIEYHRAKNAKIVILSSALTCICMEMAKYLKADDIICSELEVNNGFFTGRPVGHLCFGEEKAVRLAAYCEKYNLPASQAWYYGDSISDFPALNAVGNPVCINPDRKLSKRAARKNWKILCWNS